MKRHVRHAAVLLAVDNNNWQGGINYTWSQMKGNCGGLSSSDEGGRNSPNVERYWDLWFERYPVAGACAAPGPGCLRQRRRSARR